MTDDSLSKGGSQGRASEEVFGKCINFASKDIYKNGASMVGRGIQQLQLPFDLPGEYEQQIRVRTRLTRNKIPPPAGV
jgi:hypothetical protein